MSLKTGRLLQSLQPTHFKASWGWNVRKDKLCIHLLKHQKTSNIRTQAGWGGHWSACISKRISRASGLLLLTGLCLVQSWGHGVKRRTQGFQPESLCFMGQCFLLLSAKRKEMGLIHFIAPPLHEAPRRPRNYPSHVTSAKARPFNWDKVACSRKPSTVLCIFDLWTEWWYLSY